MPVISVSFNRFLGIMGALFGLISSANAQLPRLSSADSQWLGQQIYQNECNSNYPCLTSWNQGEDFPSLGIGHFIWFQADQIEPFEETFPALLDYLRSQNRTLPTWITDMPVAESPWLDRDEFLAELNSAKMTELREFLYDTREQQSSFIAKRLVETLPQLLKSTSDESRLTVESNFYGVAHASPPYGLYALIDYVHFKGSGIDENERYQGVGWGLQQVLLQMDNSDLYAFVEAAQVVLTRRVQNSPVQRNEGRWLLGWKNRLQTYLP
ncbi:MAG: hypothetical protein ACJA2D_000101 [Pseudohongiellaceae bacterium]|jgi:hypothetical protein